MKLVARNYTIAIDVAVLVDPGASGDTLDGILSDLAQAAFEARDAIEDDLAARGHRAQCTDVTAGGRP